MESHAVDRQSYAITLHDVTGREISHWLVDADAAGLARVDLPTETEGAWSGVAWLRVQPVDRAGAPFSLPLRILR